MRLKTIAITIFIFSFFSCTPEDSVKTIIVSGKTVPCENLDQSSCLRVKLEGEQNWTILNSNINGFEYKKDKDVTLKVKEVQKGDGTLSYDMLELIDEKQSPLELGDGSWTLTAIVDNNSFERAPFITLTPFENKIHGSTGCNKFFGTLTSDHSAFKVSEMGLTKMACPDQITERNFLRAIEAVVKYEIMDNMLHLLSKEDKILIKAKYVDQRQ